MPPLQRHSLVRLTAAGWAQVRAGDWDAEAGACLAHWAQQGLPLVVTRQPAPRAGAAPCGELALGLPAPARWSRRRIALRVPAEAVLYADLFPRMAAVAPLLPRPARAAWAGLARDLEAQGLAVRVYGSHGWQQMTGLAYLHAASDLDLLVRVDRLDAADHAAALLMDTQAAGPRLDGELLFPGGTAVAWREWLPWRAGAVGSVLAKRRDGVALLASPDALGLLPLPSGVPVLEEAAA